MCLCEGVRFPGTGVTDSSELLCGCCELNLDPLGHLEKLPALLTSELSLQPLAQTLGLVFVVFFSLVFVAFAGFCLLVCDRIFWSSGSS